MSAPLASILLVDDNAQNLLVLETILTSPKYRLVRAASADEALLALLEQEFAVIVLDVQMPKMNGLELAQFIKQRPQTQHIPIIFMSAFFEDEARMLETYDVGAVDHLTKPVSPQILRSKVAVFVELHLKTEALRRGNVALAQEIQQRQAAEAALQESHDALELRVAARTAALSEARDALAQAGLAKDDFLAALSHELRTPLNPVLLLSSEAANNPDFPEETRRVFRAIRANVELEARLIDDLLDLTRITHGKMTLDLRPRDIHQIFAAALGFVRAEIEQKRITLQLEISESSEWVLGDEVRLQQVFWNLLKNAAKFTPANGTIKVTSQVDRVRNIMALTVADTGIGLTPAEKDRIFAAFAQGDHVVTKGRHRYGGLGLGLTIAKSIVQQHRGDLLARSEGPGKGATFIVELPRHTAARQLSSDVRTEDPVAIDAPPANGNIPAPERKKILLVEDHESTRLTLTALLQRRQYDVSGAASLAEARDLAADRSFDFLISDIGLPDGSGLDLMQEMKSRRDIRGLALTGYGMEDDINCSLAAGFVAHLVKPISIDSLDRALAVLRGVPATTAEGDDDMRGETSAT